MKFRLSRRVLRDIDDIADYTLEKWGKRQRDKYVRALHERCRWVAENPELGRRRDDLLPGLRSFPEGRHLIFYLVLEDEVLIIGVLHGAMNLEAYFDRS